MDLAHGRGWAVTKGDELHGMNFFQAGKDFEFVESMPKATKWKKHP
jgi:hypothetical protein